MCFHISLAKEMEYLRERFGVEYAPDTPFEPVYHTSAFAIPHHPVVTDAESDKIQLLRWGLVPHWVKDADSADDIRMKTMNARSETAFEKPSFRDPIRKRRCMVLVDGFYEWRDFNKARYPYFIHMADGEAFALAGLWDEWTEPGSGGARQTFSILTTDANPLVAKIHNVKKRMPVILGPDDEREWLDPRLDEDDIKALMRPYDETKMAAHTVSKVISLRGGESNVPEAHNEHKYPELNIRDLDSFCE